MECRYWWYVASFTLGYIHAEKDFPWPMRGFPWVGPLAQCRHRHEPISLLPPTVYIRASPIG